MEVLKGIEFVRGVEVFIVLTVATLDLAVVSRGKDLDSLVPNTKFCQRALEQRRSCGFGNLHLIGKLAAVVGLYALNGKRKTLHTMPDEGRGGIGAVVFERF